MLPGRMSEGGVRRSCCAFSQLVTLNFARGCFGKLGNELYPARALVLGESRASELLQLRGKVGRARDSLAEDDVGVRLHQPIVIGASEIGRASCREKG